MITTVVAVLCHMIVAQPTIAPDRDCTAEEARVEVIVTDSDLDPNVDFFSCQIHGQIGVADWKMHHPIYFKAEWRIGRIKCVPGKYQVRGAA